MQRLKITTRPNVPSETVLENVKLNQSRDLPRLQMREPHDRVAVIAGGGPSLRETGVPSGPGHELWALNGVYDWFLGRVVPDRLIIGDARPICVEYVSRVWPETRCYIASQCAPAVFEALKRRDVTLWDMQHRVDGEERVQSRTLVCGGSTVLLGAMAIAWIEGYRTIHLLGCDSSFEGEAHHAYAQPINDGDARLDVWFSGKQYRTARWMASQVQEFRDLAARLIELGTTIVVHGRGLLPDVAKAMIRGDSIVTRNSLVSVSHRSLPNLGDRIARPDMYFDLPVVENFDWQDAIPEASYLVGGGGLVPGAMRRLTERSDRVIVWGTGWAYRDFDLPPRPEGLALYGSRDWGQPGADAFVPCPSCMHSAFDHEYEIDREVAGYWNPDFPIPDAELPSLLNTADEEAVFDWLGSAETIVTNSYHGAYWATLLGRKVILTGVYSGKFTHFHPSMQPVIAENWRDANPSAADGALELCRAANREFAARVKEFL